MDHDESDDSMPGQDSFIDVVCNMVGILIVLVMIVGVRASRPAEFDAAMNPNRESTQPPVDDGELRAEIAAANKAKEEIERNVARIADLSVQAALTETRRQQLAMIQATVEQEIAKRRAKLDDKGQRQFDVQRAIAETEIALARLMQTQVSLVSQAPDVEEIECVPTPLAKTVEGDEIHVRLKKGLLAVVPADALLEEVRRRGGDYIRNGLRSRDAVEDVYGPIDGFRMRLTIERHAVAVQGPPGTPLATQTAVALQGVFLPISDELGHSIDQALLPTSAFSRVLRSRRAATPAVTVWVYPDSYAELRTLKRAMWEAGVPMAIRPLPHGQQIVFSTSGSKSSAQ